MLKIILIFCFIIKTAGPDIILPPWAYLQDSVTIPALSSCVKLGLVADFAAVGIDRDRALFVERILNQPLEDRQVPLAQFYSRQMRV